jgi:transcriptional regulator with XRE-family HTH domain
MSDRDIFGPRLRRERERRGISLDTIALVTKVSVELWDGLEHNDFSRWPSGIFARAFVRDYARAVGLDADDVVDEFCRLFPIGDRRASRLIKAQAGLIGHESAYADEGGIPPGGDRRASARERQERARAVRLRIAPRALAAGLDAACAFLVAGGLSLLFGSGFWATTGVVAILYYGVSTVTGIASPGLRGVEILKQRVPALFPVQDHRAHA